MAQPATIMTRVGINPGSAGNRRIVIGKIFYVNGKLLAMAFNWSRGEKFFCCDDSN